MKTPAVFAPAALATLASTGSLSAQEPSDTAVVVRELEVVVGSRAGVADPATLSVPVAIGSAEEIARLGKVNRTDVPGSIAPSFNSTRPSAGDGATLGVAALRSTPSADTTGSPSAPRRGRTGTLAVSFAGSASYGPSEVCTEVSCMYIAPIGRHRLFERFDDSAAAAAPDAYRACYAELAERGADIPERLLRADHHEEVVNNYPFHPDLFTVLTPKTATIPQFQQTRGALRLLARMVRGLWESRRLDVWTIAPFHVDLRDEADLRHTAE